MTNNIFERNEKKIILFIVLLILTIIVIVIESISAHFYKQKNREKDFTSNYYLNQNWGRAFVEDQKKAFSLKSQYKPYCIYTARPFKSRLFNVDINGNRETINFDNNKKLQKVIYLYGGSTVYNGEVPDEYTIASLLSQRLNGIDQNYSYKVINFGVSGYVSSNELLSMLTESSQNYIHYSKPDYILFYNGVNDIGMGVYHGMPGGHFGQQDIQLRFNNFLKFIIERLKYKIKDNSFFLKLIERKKIKKFSKTECLKNAKLQNYIYLQNLYLAKKIGERDGINVKFILQPSIFTTDSKNMYDKLIKKEALENNFDIPYVIGYKEFLNSAKENSVINFTEILNSVDPNVQLFLDSVHTTHFSNYIIAKNIAEIILKNGD
jgi:hypothetical protein